MTKKFSTRGSGKRIKYITFLRKSCSNQSKNLKNDDSVIGISRINLLRKEVIMRPTLIIIMKGFTKILSKWNLIIKTINRDCGSFGENEQCLKQILYIFQETEDHNI